MAIKPKPRTKAKLQQLRDYAKLLYTREKISQKEISLRVGVSEVSISKWAKADNWEGMKLNLSVTREERMMSTIMQLTELDNSIANQAAGFRYPNSKEADIRRKLVSDLAALEVECNVKDVVNVSVKLLEWIRNIDIGKAQEISDYFDAYIKEQMR
jgi:transcriptional regulator with XRE-family HTH domain